jgi:hypothetical protein
LYEKASINLIIQSKTIHYWSRIHKLMTILLFFFFSFFIVHWHYSPTGPRPTSMKLSISIRFFFLNHRQSLGLLGRVISSSEGLSTCTQTQKNAHTQTLNIHALTGIRTYDRGFRASEDSTCLRPLSYRDRQYCYYTKLLWKIK